MTKEKIRLLVQQHGIASSLKHPEWLIDIIASNYVALLSDSIVINGFWRSGTTWLLEAVTQAWNAKPVFEPLVPVLKSYEPYLQNNYRHLIQEDGTFVDGLMPYCGSDINACPELAVYLKSVLKGGSPDYFTRLTRENIRTRRGQHSELRLLRAIYRIIDAMQTRVVTKFVRAHLILPGLHATYGMPVFHIRRDPRAVVESLRRQKWSKWIRSANLSTLLLEPNDGREDYFSHWESEIHHLDESNDYIARIAAYWSLTERYVDDHVRNENVVFLQFEDLCRGHERYFNSQIPGTLALHAAREDFVAESRTSNRKTDVHSVEERLRRWRTRLSAEEANTIERVVTDFGMEKYLVT